MHFRSNLFLVSLILFCQSSFASVLILPFLENRNYESNEQIQPCGVNHKFGKFDSNCFSNQISEIPTYEEFKKIEAQLNQKINQTQDLLNSKNESLNSKLETYQLVHLNESKNLYNNLFQDQKFVSFIQEIVKQEINKKNVQE